MNPALPGNDRGKWASALLAVLVHVVLGLFLFYGIRWQNRLPDPVEVELVSPPPPAAAQVAPPQPPAPPAPARPAPPPPPPKPEPDDEPEPPPRKRPDIAIKAPEPRKQPPKPEKELVRPEPKKPEPRPEPKPEPRKPEPRPEPKKPEPKPEPRPEPKKPEPKPEPKKPDPREAARAEAQARAEQARLDKIRADKEARDAKVAAERSRALEERRMRELMAHDSEHAKQSGEIQKELARIANEKAKASDSRALKAYADKIAAKVRGNIILPPGVSGNPVGVFYVDQLPDGSVIEVRLKRSTGNAQLDAAIERAIQKSSPLPKPDRSELFQRTLNFEFYPLRD